MSEEFLDWKQLSAAASLEQDPRRLMELVEKLNEVLEAQQQLARGRQTSRTPIES